MRISVNESQMLISTHPIFFLLGACNKAKVEQKPQRIASMLSQVTQIRGVWAITVLGISQLQ